MTFLQALIGVRCLEAVEAAGQTLRQSTHILNPLAEGRLTPEQPTG